MTGGTVVVLGPVGANFGAGMTGGRAYLYDPTGRHVAALDTASVGATRLSIVLRERADGPERNVELRGLLEDQRAAGSTLAERLLALDDLPSAVWVVEPVVAVAADASPAAPTTAEPSSRAPRPEPQPAGVGSTPG